MKLIVATPNEKKNGRRAEQYRGWNKSGLRAGQMKGVMSDEDFHYILGYHKPAWVHILDRLPHESKHPIVVFGKYSIPVAIELSQWGYPVSYLVKDWDEEKHIARTLDVHFGQLKIIQQDYLKNIPRCKAVFITDLLEYFTNIEELHIFMDMLLSRAKIVFISTTSLKNWRAILGDCYDVKMKKYRSNFLLTIKKV